MHCHKIFVCRYTSMLQCSEVALYRFLWCSGTAFCRDAPPFQHTSLAAKAWLSCIEAVHADFSFPSRSIDHRWNVVWNLLQNWQLLDTDRPKTGPSFFNVWRKWYYPSLYLYLPSTYSTQNIIFCQQYFMQPHVQLRCGYFKVIYLQIS